MTCGIVAASALGAGGRTSCKRQVIDSDPDGSQQARLAFFVVAERDKRNFGIGSNNFRSAEYEQLASESAMRVAARRSSSYGRYC